MQQGNYAKVSVFMATVIIFNYFTISKSALLKIIQVAAKE